eukprot:1195872-Prorocentrum_minimum.AAC.9
MASERVRHAIRRLAPTMRKSLIQVKGNMFYTATRVSAVGGVARSFAVARRCACKILVFPSRI